jgi:hypothetical protein
MLSTGTQFSAPERSLQQRMEALERANRIRSARAAWKDDVKRHPELRTAPFADPSFATMKAETYLMAMPKVGRTKARKILHQARVSPSRTLGGMTERQRVELLSMLPAPRRTIGR